MNQFPLHPDEDQDSLFGSPPPSPARGRSPSQDTFIAGGKVGPIIAVPSTGVGRENVGTIALPGSHMSCAELPANLSASSLSLSRPTSSHASSSIAPPSIAGMPTSVHTPAVKSRSSTHSVPSRASSTAGTSTSASVRQRRPPKSKSKSLTPISPAPPITLPGPNEPTPPNFLRSQSSLLGLAGLIGSVKPAQLYTHGPQPTPVQQSRSHSPIRGSTPTNPIVLDDDQEQHPCGQHQMPQCLDQLDPEILRSNIMNSLTKEKNIFPVLESLIKLLGGEPHLPSTNPLSQPFARPYGHGIFNARPSSSVAPLSPPGSFTTTAAIPPPKRRKLKHVPAGAVDWDVPFPFAAGEGPQAYRDTWARDRAKQLVTQLLELVQNAAKRAAIKTAKGGRRASKGRTGARNCQSRSASVETQIGQITSAQANVCESPLSTSANAQDAVTGMSVDSLGHFLASLETPSTIDSSASGSKDRMFVDSEGAVEEGGWAVPCDYSTFEEWLSQLQQFVPLETSESTPESDWITRLSAPLNSSASSPAPDTLTPMQRNVSTAPHVTPDEAIDPALFAISQQDRSAPRSQSPTSPTSTLAPGDARVLDISSTPPALTHSPRTSLSSLTEPLTPLSEAFADVPTSIVHQDLVYGMQHPLTTRGCTDTNPAFRPPYPPTCRKRPSPTTCKPSSSSGVVLFSDRTLRAPSHHRITEGKDTG